MRHIKTLLILFTAFQIFATPIVNSCSGLVSITEKTCCPPSECLCDISNVDISDTIDAIKSDIEFNSYSITAYLGFDLIRVPNTQISNLNYFSNLPPPLQRDSDPFSFNQTYIL